MNKDKRTKNIKKEAIVDKTKVQSAYQMESKSKYSTLDLAAPKLKK